MTKSTAASIFCLAYFYFANLSSLLARGSNFTSLPFIFLLLSYLSCNFLLLSYSSFTMSLLITTSEVITVFFSKTPLFEAGFSLCAIGLSSDKLTDWTLISELWVGASTTSRLDYYTAICLLGLYSETAYWAEVILFSILIGLSITV